MLGSSKVSKCLTVLIGALCCVLGTLARAEEHPDVGPDLPYLLTKAEAHALAQPGGNWFKEGCFYNCEGFGVTVSSINNKMIMLRIKAGVKTNLGYSIQNMAGRHGGRLELNVVSVLDENGNDIFDRTREQEWRKRINPGKFEDGYYTAGRDIPIKPSSSPLPVKQINLKATLSLPVDWSDFTFAVGQTKTGVHPLLTKVETQHGGVQMSHPEPWRNAVFFVFGLDAANKRVPISSMGSAGKAWDNHWFFPRKDDHAVTVKMRVLMAAAVVEEELLFSLTPSLAK